MAGTVALTCSKFKMQRVICSATCSVLARVRPPHRLWFACSYHSGDGVYGHRPQKQQPSPLSPDDPSIQNRIRNSNLYRFVSAYREYGHKLASTDPLQLQKPNPVLELDPKRYGLSPDTTQDQYDVEGIVNMGTSQASLTEIITALDKMYKGPLAVELGHLQTEAEKDWVAEAFEQMQQETISDAQRVDMAKLMLKSQAFDHFLASKFTTVKRYGGEGAESAMVFYQELFKMAANSDIENVIVCIAHRGRLNLLACLLQFPPVVMFRKMKGLSEFPPGVAGSGDVLSHLTSSVDLPFEDKNVHVTMVPNPSHLEAVNPVAVGKARGRMQSLQIGDYAPNGVDSQNGDKVLCFQIHGDAAFAAQGIVPETFALADAPHFSVGGSVHLVINNQIGFTTDAERGRSSPQTTCLAKVNGCPIIRVNADYPEEVVKACRLAVEYRQKFHKDVVVDYICYRRWGHNELDEPGFTQPNMYDVIRSRRNIPDLYADSVVESGLAAREDLTEGVSTWNTELSSNMGQVETHVPKANHLEKQWAGFIQAQAHITRWDTGVSVDLLKFIGAQSVTVPEDLKVHPTLKKTHIDRRLQKLEEGRDLDWATAEALAFGSLLAQDFNVRISGQDVGRGTFSHRHVMLVDQETEAVYIPLNNMAADHKGKFEVANSILSEEAVLGFEYGMSIENPRTLAIWEAQFGDFFNGAQIIIDTFITGGETKWLLQSSLVMLLPHGIDGAGPEHSSCRVERFLQMCDSKEDGIDGDNVNYQIVNPSTPAQYFHVLRRQMIRNYRKPLVVVTPKGLLRHPSVVSSLSEMAPGTTFEPVLGDPTADPGQVTKVIFMSGKQYYTLAKEREARQLKDVALIRLESLCPFPAEEIRAELNKYNKATDFVWSQEEHRNHGAWSFVSPRFENVIGHKLRYVGREVHATPATGIGQVHQQECAHIVEASFS